MLTPGFPTTTSKILISKKKKSLPTNTSSVNLPTRSGDLGLAQSYTLVYPNSFSCNKNVPAPVFAILSVSYVIALPSLIVAKGIAVSVL